LSAINKVRQSLNILTLTDMVDLRGKRLLRNIREGKKERKSKFLFTKQEPTQKWKKWWTQKACPILQKAVMKNPLGKWKSPTHQKWEWSYESETDTLFRGPDRYKKLRNVYIHQQVQHDPIVKSQPNMWADIQYDRNGRPYIIALSPKNDIVMSNEIPPKTTYRDRYGKMWGEIHHVKTKEILINNMKNSKTLIVTDGSNWNDEGAQAWGNTDEDGEFLVKGRGRVACAKSDASSLRPELHALLAATTYATALMEEEDHINTVKIPIYTDSANAIIGMQSSLYPTTKNVLENNIDMKLELKNVLRESSIQFQLQHVRAHQDQVKPYEELTLPEQLNCEIDKYAGEVYRECKLTFLATNVKYK